MNCQSETNVKKPAQNQSEGKLVPFYQTLIK
jgi:hypothetical protein